MNDLISRSALIEKLEEKMFDSKLMCPVIKLTDLIELIDEQPTAYDVDKVLEELNEQWNDASCIDDDMYCIGVANGLAAAINIIKRGGE